MADFANAPDPGSCSAQFTQINGSAAQARNTQHLLSAEELQQRGTSSKRARLVIQAYPVLVLSQEWLEQL
jgi:hypothetical protein